MASSSESELNSSSSSGWSWLWTIMKFFWGSVVLAVLINLLTSDVIFSALFSWIKQHLLLSALLSTGLIMLSVVAWWASRHTSRISSLVFSASLQQQNRHRFLTKLNNRYADILEHSRKERHKSR